MGGRNITLPFLSVYGHVTIDHIMAVDDFPENNTSVNVLSDNMNLGGTSTNISAVASSLGVPTAICSLVGTDFPKKFHEFIESCGVITDELIVCEEHPTAVAIIINDRNFNQRVLFYQGPLGSASHFNHSLIQNAKRSRFAHFSTGEPKYYIDIMKKLEGEKTEISLDPAQEIHHIWNSELFNTALGVSHILFCNQYEAGSVMKYTGHTLSEIDCGRIVCTKGSGGSEAYINGEMISIPVVKPKIVKDTTGAGDAYRAGFYAGQYRGFSFLDSLVIGASAASFIVEEVGALSNIPTWEMVLERADKYLGVQ